MLCGRHGTTLETNDGGKCIKLANARRFGVRTELSDYASYLNFIVEKPRVRRIAASACINNN